MADIVALLNSLFNTVTEWASSLNPVVASFIISFVFNSIPYLSIPYLVVIAGYGASTSITVYEKLLIAIIGGLGAALGKLVVFYLGRGIHRLLPQNTRANLEDFANIFKRGIFITVFLFASTPSPDDLLYVPLGVAGYNPILFLIAVTLGKIVVTGAAIFFGVIVREELGSTASATTITIAILVGSIIVLVILSRMNWKRLAKIYETYGLLAFLLELIVQALVALAPRGFRKRVEEKTDGLLLKLAARRRER